MKLMLFVVGVIGLCVAQSVGQSSSPRVLEIKAIERLRNPRISPEIRFDAPMDRKSTENAISLFIGSYNPNQVLPSFQNLRLYCGSAGWAVENPNPFPMSFAWKSFPSNERGIGVVPAEGDSILRMVEKSGKVQINFGKDSSVESSFLPICNFGTNSERFGDSFLWSPDNQRTTLRPRFFEAVHTPYTIAVSTGAQDKSGKYIDEPAWLTFTPQALGATWGILEPGVILNGPDGITISISNQKLQKPVRIFFQKVSPDVVTSDRRYFTPIGNFYRIGSPDDVPYSPGMEQTIGFKVPQNIELSKTDIVYLENSAFIADTSPPYTYFWVGTDAKRDVENHQLSLTWDSMPYSDGLIYGVGASPIK
jgi:hypothetical protein